MKFIKVTTSKTELKGNVSDELYKILPRKGSILKLENAQQLICKTRNVINWRKNSTYFNPQFECVRISKDGTYNPCVYEA